MNPRDLLILTVYLLCLTYFVYQIIHAFNDEFTVRLDEESLKQKLTEQNLQEAIALGFRFDKRYEYDKFKQLAISLNNKSESDSIYVDWDCSTLTDLEGRARRVTRLMPGSTVDLFQPQASSTVTPKTTLKEIITAEDSLQRKGDRKDNKLPADSPLNLEVEISKPLIDLTPAKPSDPLKKKLARFKDRELELEFFLEIALRLLGPNRPLGGDRIQVNCRFILTKLPWTAGLPWNPR